MLFFFIAIKILLPIFVSDKVKSYMQNRNLVSISDLSKDEIIALLKRAQEFEKNPNQHILDGKVVGSLFFEPSSVLVSASRLP